MKTNTINEFSPNELIILRGLGCDDRLIEFGAKIPVRFLADIGNQCWTNQINNEYSEALRKALVHINSGKYRANPEYEKLIELPKKPQITYKKFEAIVTIIVSSDSDYVANEERFPDAYDIQYMIQENVSELECGIIGQVHNCREI